MKIHHILSVLISAALFCSCEKDLDLKYHYIDPLTVIEAELTPDGMKAGITLTTPMDEPMDRTRLTDASVTLTDLTSATEYYLTPDADGYYVDPTPGIPGHDYRLTVEREGDTYVAETHMYPPVEITGLEFKWIKMPYDNVAVFQGQFTDDTSAVGDCFWIKLYRNGKIYMWNEQDDRGAVDGQVTFFTMTSRMDTDEEDDDEALFDGDVLTFSVSRITRSMHDYLEALQNDSSGPAMFSGPRCLGYFIATSPVSESIEFHPDRIPFYR
ncbi:MAG: DUF4249 domain-containing protein [Muribaculaceae bacterium]|nr:DUF4249 domain-containing protein [Muribaculaceae bacterium]